MDVTEHWDFSDPATTEKTFRKLADRSEDPIERSIYMTQVARTFSLRRDFDAAKGVLNDIDPTSAPEVQVRWSLEMGRTENSAGHADLARPHFEAATKIAAENGLDFLHVDAVHMEAIVAEAKLAKALNLKAIDIAEKSSDPTARRWLGSLLNNLGWAHHDDGEFAEALDIFEKSVVYFDSVNKPERADIGRWSVARTLRSLGRNRDALEILEALLVGGDSTGYTHQEIGWNKIAIGEAEAARPHLQAALDKLSADPWVVKNQADQLEAMRAELG